MSFLEEVQHLSIPFRDIEEGTNKFTTHIGKGGYGNVYKGELSLSEKPTTVAVKRLENINLSGQGLKEFLTEIHLLSRYKHPNLVSLLGYCEEGDEKIIIYEYAHGGSLDKYLRRSGKTTPPLDWKQRINICIDAAQGLDYLHNHVAENHRVIHRDIKSANILLDQNLKAKITDFGLSKIGRANENDTYLITDASGTYGYCDPVYIDTGILTKESDVYSFGVVLFEILCGRLCYLNVNNEQAFLAPLAQRFYKETRLKEIIDPDLKEHMDSESLRKFAEIAYQCLLDERELRPSMGLVVQKLTEALQSLKLEERRTKELEETRRMQATYNFQIPYLTDSWSFETLILEERRMLEFKYLRNYISSIRQKSVPYGINPTVPPPWQRAWRPPSPLKEKTTRDSLPFANRMKRFDKLQNRLVERRTKTIKSHLYRRRFLSPSTNIHHRMALDFRPSCNAAPPVNIDGEAKIYENSSMTYDTMMKLYSQISKGFYMSHDKEKWFWSHWLKPKMWNDYAAAERNMKAQKTSKRQEQKTIKNIRGRWKRY